jgi:uncharacterized protein
VGALVIAAIFAVLASFTSNIYPVKDQPQSEIHIIVPGQQQLLGDVKAYVNPASEIKKDHLIKQGYDYSCGSAALAILLNFYLGEKFTEKQVIQGLLHYGDLAQIQKRQAFSLLDMKKFVKALGYEAEGYKAEMEDLKSITTPCIIPIKVMEYRHFVVFRGIYKGHVLLTDPWRGDTSYVLNDFYDIWYEKVMFVVSNKNGRVLNTLKLKPEDLSFIDEEITREIIFGNDINSKYAASERELKLIIDNQGKYQYYRAKK